MLPYNAKGYNLLPDILILIPPGHWLQQMAPKKQKQALTHHDRLQAFINQLSIDVFTPDFLRAQSDAASHCEGKSICA